MIRAAPPTRAAPEEALHTPGAFLAWLLEAQAHGRRGVGQSSSATRCPLATFARTHLGLQAPAVSCACPPAYGCPPQEGGDAHGHSGLGMHYRSASSAGAYLPLPPWCLQFALRVDDQPVDAISPRRALRLLGEVLQNQEHAP